MKLSDYKEQKDIKDLVTGKLFEEEKVQEVVVPLVEEKKIENTIESIETKLPEEPKIEEPKPKKFGIEEYKKQQEIKKAIEESFKELVNMPKLIKKDDNIIIEGTGEITRQDIINSVVEKLKDDSLFLDKVKELKEEDNENVEPKPVDQPNRSTAFTGGGFTVTQINSLIDEYIINHPEVLGVTSIFGRMGNVISQANDYKASQIQDDSSATPAPTNVKNALNYIRNTIELLALSAGNVTSVFGRAANVQATVGDYSASFITNDSSVSGITVKQALNVLSNTKAPINHAVNASTYGYSTTANAGHVRIGDGFLISDGTITNNFHPSTGLLKDIISIDNNNGTITLPQASAVFYSNALNQGLAKSYILSAITTSANKFPPIPQGLSYLVGKYNNGNPIYSLITDVTEINLSNVIPIATVSRYNDDLHILDWDETANGLIDKTFLRFVKTDRFKNETGMILGIGTNRKITVTAGIYWIGLHRIYTSAFDSTDINNGQYVMWHTTSSGTWVQTSATQYNNSQYDTGTGLTDLTGNRFNINWIYWCAATNEKQHIFNILSNTQYNTLADAELAQPRSDLPDQVKAFGVLIGRIIVQLDSSIGTVESAWTTTFTPSLVINHNDTGNLNIGDYRHLTLRQYNSISADNFVNKYNISGTANFIPAYKTSSTMHNSCIRTENTNKMIGINVSPSATFDVSGTTRFGGHNKNYTAFDQTGHQTMVSAARPWRDELSDAIALQQTGPGVSRNTTESTVEFTTGSNLSDFLFANMQLNHDRDTTTVISPHIHFFQEQNRVPNFLIQYRWHTLGGYKKTVWNNLKCNVPIFTYTSGSLHQIAQSVDIAPPANSNISDIVQFKIFRDNANNSTVFTGVDTYSATVGVLAFDIHIQLNSLGSTDEYVK